MTNQTISTNVSITQTAVEVAIRDARPEALTSLTGMTPSQQGQLAHEAWLIGYRAVTSAHRLAEDARLNDIGKTLLEDIDRQLRSHAERQAERMQGAFATYFDPESG